MADIEPINKKVDDTISIEIKLSSIMQIFNSFDPAPFHEKELDSAAEHYITETVKDFPAKTKFKMIIYLPKELAQGEQAQKIKPAIQHHFEYRMLGADRQYRSHFRYGQIALVIGLSFLAVTLLARQIVSSMGHDLIALILADALLIFGWAAMWEPITVLLYELWPIIQMKKVYQRISEMEIDFVPLP